METHLKFAEGRAWKMVNGDCVEYVAGLPDNSVDMIVYSPPFESLFSYSDDPRDMSNSSTSAEFHTHYGFLASELARVLKPGRNICVHCMVLPTSKTRDGVIGLRDFPGDLIRTHQSTGLIFHSKVTIWKDPVVAMQRTKALGLLWKQIQKDSTMSRMGLPDEVLTFRKPGENAVPVSHSKEEFPVAQWQKWASPVWDDIDQSDVLPCRAAKEEDDQKHLCPLQLEVIRRCVRLWSNPGELVLSPFGGVGSEPYVAVEEGRRAIACELKRSYWQQACANLGVLDSKSLSLFDVAVPVPPLADDDTDYALPDEDADGVPLPPPAYPQFSGPDEPLPEHLREPAAPAKKKRAPRKPVGHRAPPQG